MINQQFSPNQFQNALLEKKMKLALQPFLQQYEANNIKWMLQSVNILRNNLVNQHIEPIYKVATILASKIFVQTCHYVLVELIQTYILPEIMKIAQFEPDIQFDKRGQKYFKTNYVASEEMETLGINLVTSASGFVLRMYQIKPYKLYSMQQTNDASQFTIAKDKLRKLLKFIPKQIKNFMKVSEKRELYIENLKKFANPTHHDPYLKQIKKLCLTHIKNNFQEGELDIAYFVAKSEISLSTEICFACEEAIIEKKQGLRFIHNTIQFINLIVETGNDQPRVFLHQCNLISILVQKVLQIQGNQKNLKRGEKFLSQLQGTPQLRISVYCRFLERLQLWAKTELSKDFYDQTKPSKIAYYYELLLVQKQIQFPKIPEMKIKLDQILKKREKQHQSGNKLLYEDIKTILEPTELDKLIKHIQTPKSWIYNSSKIKSQQKQPSNLELMMRENMNSKANRKSKSIKQNNNQEYQILSQQLYTSFCKQARILLKLHQIPESIHENIAILFEENSRYVSLLDGIDMSEEGIDEILDQHSAIEEAIDVIKGPIVRYRTNKINFQEFSEVLAEMRKVLSWYVEQLFPNEQNNKKEGNELIKKNPENHGSQRQKGVPLSIKPFSVSGSKPKKQEASNQNQQSPLKEKKVAKKQQQEKNLLYFSELISESDNGLNDGNLQQVMEPEFEKIIIKPLEVERNALEEPLFQFSTVGFNKQSQIASNKVNSEQNTILIPKLKGQIIHIQPENIKPSFRKIQPDPITNQLSKTKTSKNQHIQPINKQSQVQLNQISQDDNDDIIIQADFQPLDTSYHDPNSPYNKKLTSFREVINQTNTKDSDKIGKKQKLFWLKYEAESIIKCSQEVKNQRSRNQSKVDIPGIMEERNKKHEEQIKVIEENRDKKLKELQQRLKQIEKEKHEISTRLKQRQSTLQILKEELLTEQVDYADDQEFIMRKMNSSKSKSKKKGHNSSQQKNNIISNEGQLINTQPYQPYLSDISTQKQRKMHLKNKSVLYKDDRYEIGCTGQKKQSCYLVTCFITPFQDCELAKIKLDKDDNLTINVQTDFQSKISANKQERVYFLINVDRIPYQIPYASFHFRVEKQDYQIKVFLPVGFHKFVTIRQSNEQFKEQFTKYPIVKGVEISYSKRALKNIDSIQDYFPHFHKLKDEEPNDFGEITYGGEAFYQSWRFLLKISIKPNQFLYVQAANPIRQKNEHLTKIIQFYIASINHFLMKEFQERR